MHNRKGGAKIGAPLIRQQAGQRNHLARDIAQPRGGPALSGHASHQIGLDADIWLTPMPNR
ncbi:MAG: penicillin-insensitive murein endopeptidase, partial [Gallionellaceae bacterium]|nr:penicillin-insensitive murein endopeptidase [Gallionellaceae bacterium]